MEVAGYQIKGVIFDMDGVLLFSNEIHEKSLQACLLRI